MILEKFVAFLYPDHLTCIVCQSELGKGEATGCCETCLSTIQSIDYKTLTCKQCGKPVMASVEALKPYFYKCKPCQEQFSFLKAHRSYALYEGAIKKMLMDIKYHDKTQALKFLAQSLKGVYDGELKDAQIDYVVCVPIHFTRRLKRQYNQAELLAKAFSPLVGLGYIPALKRIKRTKRLKLLSRDERKVSLHRAISIKSEYKNKIMGKNILIIDDIYTTGATLNTCASVLYECGAANLYALTVATGQ